MGGNFKEVASTALASYCEELMNKMEDKARVCRDQFVGIISDVCHTQDELKNKYKKFSRIVIDESWRRAPDCPCLILILESPHKAELRSKVPEPAKGATGNNIRDYLRQISSLSKFNNHGLILMNAIQYQCSLGLPTECVRDRIFNKFWEEEGRDSFTERLKLIFRDGDVILNCCTAGAGKAGLVTESIKSVSKGLGIKSLLLGSHPSYWGIKENLSPSKFMPILMQ